MYAPVKLRLLGFGVTSVGGMFIFSVVILTLLCSPCTVIYLVQLSHLTLAERASLTEMDPMRTQWFLLSKLAHGREGKRLFREQGT